MRSYAKRFDEQDEQLLVAADSEQMRVRQQKHAEWNAFLEDKHAWRQEEQEQLINHLGHHLLEPVSQLAEADVQQVVDVKEEHYTA